MTDIKKCVIYCRVSSTKQLKEGWSVPAQRRFLNDYAKKYEYKIAKDFYDDETAGKTGRKGFQEMLEFLKSPEGKDIQTIMVEKTDRMYRNLKDYIYIEDLGIDVILAKENEVIGKNASSHTKFIHGIKVLMAKNFLDNLSEEVKKGYDEKLQAKLYPNNPMYGYTTTKINGKRILTPKEDEAVIVKRIFELRASKQPFQAITEQIEKEFGIIVHKSKIYGITENPVYYGDFLWKGEIYEGIHEPIITKSLWKEVQAVKASFKNASQSKRYNTIPFQLKGMMVCGECGRNITAEKKKGKYVYYRCTKYHTHCTQKAVKEETLLPQIEQIIDDLKIPKTVVEDATTALKQSLDAKRESEDQTVKILKVEEGRLESRLDQMYEDLLDGKIDEDLYTKKKGVYKERLSNIRDQLKKHQIANSEYYNLGEEILELAKNAYSLYQNANPEERAELLGFLLSNFSLKDGKLVPEYKKPFDTIVKYATCSDWQAQEDSNPY